MEYTFKRGSQIKIEGSPVFHLSDYSLSQTISERTTTRNSLFSRNLNTGIINRRRNVGEGNFSFYYSRETSLDALLQSVGFSKELKYYGEAYASPIDLEIHTGNEILTPKQAIITSIDIQLTPRSMGIVDVTYEFSSVEKEENSSNLLILPNWEIPSQRYLTLDLGRTTIAETVSATVSITREIDWKDSGQNHFNLGELAEVGTPVLTTQNVIALVNTNYKRPEHYNTILNEDVKIATAEIEILFPDARITTRTDTDGIFRTAYDIKHQSEHLPISIRRK